MGTKAREITHIEVDADTAGDGRYVFNYTLADTYQVYVSYQGNEAWHDGQVITVGQQTIVPNLNV